MQLILVIFFSSRLKLFYRLIIAPFFNYNRQQPLLKLATENRPIFYYMKI